MKTESLPLLITVIGAFSFLFSLLIIILGKKVGEGGKQTIKVGQHIDISTNSVLTLVVITALFTLVPLYLVFTMPDALYQEYSIVRINGFVNDENGTPTANVKIDCVRNFKGKYDTLTKYTSNQGSFSFVLEDARPFEDYEMIVDKPGYTVSRINFGFNTINFPITISRTGGE